MNSHPDVPETQDCGGGRPAGTLRSTATTKPSEREAYLALFIGVLTGGSVINIVYEVIFATSSLADTIHSIITDMWRPPVIAFYVTLTAAGISKSVRSMSRRLRQLLPRSKRQ